MRTKNSGFSPVYTQNSWSNMQHPTVFDKDQRLPKTTSSFLILNLSLLPWDTCSLKHIIMRGSISNRPTTYLEAWPTGGNTKGISPEQCFIFMKKNSTLIYLLWYSIDPCRRDVVFTYFPSQGAQRSWSATEDRRDSVSSEGHFSRCLPPQRPWNKNRPIEGQTPFSLLYSCISTDRTDLLVFSFMYFFSVNFTARAHWIVSGKACFTVLERFEMGPLWREYNWHCTDLAFRLTETAQTLGSFDSLMSLLWAQFLPSPAHVKINISTWQNFQCLSMTAILRWQML